MPFLAMGPLTIIYLCSLSAGVLALKTCAPGAPIQPRVRRAPVVFHGLTLQPTVTTGSGTNAPTQFWLIDVYKGSHALSKVLDIDLPESGVLDVRDRKLNVSGSLMRECGLELSEGVTQRHFIVIATVQDNKLVASGDAANLEPWTSSTDNIIWLALGWNQWSDWSACTVSCGEGIQQRLRHCKRPEHCEGFNKQTRRCNMFPCRGAVTPLHPDRKRYLHGQWSRTPDRPTAWRVRPSSYLWLPATELPAPATHLRKHFGLLLTLRLHSKESSTGTLFSLRSRSVSNAYLSLELAGRDAIRLVHSNTNSTQTVLIPTPLGDGHWHQLALGVQEDSSVHSYLDCHWVSTDILRRDSLDIPEDADLVIGYLFSGDLEQLVVVADPNLASQQCATSLESSVQPDDAYTTLQQSKHSSDHRKQRKHHRTDSQNDWYNNNGENEIQIDDEDFLEGSGSGMPLEKYEYTWTEWSKCSVTCGMGVQTRMVACSVAGVWMDLCLEAGKEKTETRPCNAPPCTVPNKEAVLSNITTSKRQGNACGCRNGGTCHIKRQACHCPSGFQGLRCEIRSCPGPCLHGGVCHNSGYCSCPPEYTGETCQTPVCHPPCMNGGQCIKPGVCSCPTQFNHPRCAALCPGGCEPGGACVSPGVCQCRPGFRGSLCQESLCPRGCFNGGTCISDNVCNCTFGWTGLDCSIPVCDQPCQRGGQCVGPQQCLCPAGTLGHQCQNFTCTIGCVNGGVCVGPDLCECPANATGPSCGQPLCDPPCENGATCAQGNTCICSTHTSGTRCQIKNCDYRFVQEPYTRGYKKLLKKRIQTNCGEGMKTCDRTIAEYQTIYKTFYRTVYKCTSDQAR